MQHYRQLVNAGLKFRISPVENSSTSLWVRFTVAAGWREDESGW
jgi:hypothetical protein